MNNTQHQIPHPKKNEKEKEADKECVYIIYTHESQEEADTKTNLKTPKKN